MQIIQFDGLPVGVTIQKGNILIVGTALIEEEIEEEKESA